MPMHDHLCFKSYGCGVMAIMVHTYALPSAAATTHFLIAGATGSGKTLTINQLMNSALPKIGRTPGHRALIYDAKQDVLSGLHAMRLGCRILTLHPFDTRCAAWDIAQDVTSPAAALQVATILIPEEHGQNRFFSDAARHLLSGVLISFIQKSPGAWTFSDVIRAMKSKHRIRGVLERTVDGVDLLDSYFTEERVLHNILATVQTKLMNFEPIAAAWAHANSKISLKEWIDGEFVLVLGSDESLRAPLGAINQVIFKRLSELILAQTESATRRTWLFLDEVREAGKLEGLSRLMTKGRSKGACVVLGFQDIEGMREVYGQHVAHEICGQCSQKAFLRMESEKTARWAADVVGQVEEISKMSSESVGWQRSNRTLSEQRSRSDVVMPSEFLTIPPTNPAPRAGAPHGM